MKMEADRGYPQAASAHDTFWDFVGLMPESTHMIMWVMSDRAIPRSLRMIEGFGVNTFRLLERQGRGDLRKVPLAPQARHAIDLLGRSGQDRRRRSRLPPSRPARRDRCGNFRSGSSVCSFSARSKPTPSFDILDATKVIPEELVPIQVIGRMVLDRNPDNFFAETEQVAFLPTNIPPGIDVSEDPLLQGRLFSYQDTQLSRLGTVNFHQIPVNSAKGCPFQNLQRDGHMQTQVFTGRANYEPNSLGGRRRSRRPARGSEGRIPQLCRSLSDTKVRLRSESALPTITATRGCSTGRRPRSSRRTWRARSSSSCPR